MARPTGSGQCLTRQRSRNVMILFFRRSAEASMRSVRQCSKGTEAAFKGNKSSPGAFVIRIAKVYPLFSGKSQKKSLYTAISRYTGIFAAFAAAHFSLVEAAGIEPASENRFIRSSTSVVCHLISRNAAPTNRLCEPAAHCATADYVRPRQTFTAS